MTKGKGGVYIVPSSFSESEMHPELDRRGGARVLPSRMPGNYLQTKPKLSPGAKSKPRHSQKQTGQSITQQRVPTLWRYPM